MKRNITFFFLFFFVVVYFNTSLAQKENYQQFPGVVELVRLKKGERSGLVEDTFFTNVGVFYEGESGFARIRNTSKETYYFSVIDIQPDNKINVLTQYFNREPEDLKISGGETYRFPDYIVEPPFGIDKFVVIFSKTPIYFIQENATLTRSSFSGVKLFGREELLQHTKWILEGKPSTLFSDCFFSITDLVILPAETRSSSSIHTPVKNGGQAAQLFRYMPRLWIDSCSGLVADHAQLFISFPLLDFIQPLQSGASRSEPVDEVFSKSYVLKGRAMALKGISKVMINDQEAIVDQVSAGKFAWEKEVYLKNGHNRFRVTAITSENKQNCETISLFYDSLRNQVTDESSNYLFLIGINEYTYWKPLNGATHDLDSVKSMLISSFGFKEEHLIELRNHAANRDAIDSVFRLLIRKVKPSDNVIVFFAGHGTLDKEVNEGYWIPVEARKQKPNDYISNSSIKKYMEAINAHHTLILADACFSGGFFKTTRGETFEDKVEKMRSRWVFCSGREEEVADRATGKNNSPFTHYLVKTLRECQEKMALSELVLKVKTAVANNTEQTPVAGPVVNTGDEGGEIIFRKKK